MTTQTKAGHAGILRNTATGRFHPIFFRPAPKPSETGEKVCRHKSIGHHTDGLDTIEKARDFINSTNSEDSGLVWEWDGTDVPAMTWLFELKSE